MKIRKERCGNGHAMTPENTYLRSGTEPVCRECHRQYRKASRARRREREQAGETVVPRQRLSTRERLLSQVKELPNGCWEWTGFINKEGYGRTYFEGSRSVPAQQAMYRMLVGPIPEGKVLDHACHTADASCSAGNSCPHRRCVNPAHLEPVSGAENTARGAWARKTHCPKGHPYNEENTLVSRGRRYCRTCQRASAAAQQAKKKAAKAVAA